MDALTIYTIGHSTHSLDELATVLRKYGVKQLVDIRTVPRSRTNPQFNADVMGDSLAPYGIGYLPMRALGGLRKPRPDSPNGAWENASFRGYADYMQSPAFAKAIERLEELARQKTSAIMCAEAVPWRCHRSLVGDALVARGTKVLHVMSATKVITHEITRFAHVDGVNVTYPEPSS